MKIKSQRDFWSGLLFIIVGIGFAWGATSYGLGTPERPGPGYLPLGLGLLLALLGAVVLFGALSVETDDGDPIGAIGLRPLLCIVLAIVAFALLLEPLGLLLTLPIVAMLCAAADRAFHWKSALVGAAALTGGAWLLFIKLLALALPLWPATG